MDSELPQFRYRLQFDELASASGGSKGLLSSPFTLLRRFKSLLRHSSTRRRSWFLGILMAVTLWSLWWLYRWRYWAMNALSYSLRPIYDTPEFPRNFITHLHSPSIPTNDSAACERHGWSVWRGDNKIVDAIIFSVELDILEIRLAELSPLVSHFLILESTTTFTGLQKPLVLPPLLNPNSRFGPYLNKIKYKSIDGRKLREGESPFAIENEMRSAMGNWLMSSEGGVMEGDLVIMSDTDEIPSRSALSLVASCTIPSPLHLGMSQHIYNYHWSLSPLPISWRARVVRYSRQNPAIYSHGMTNKVAKTKKNPNGNEAWLLTDSGWHCSSCFKTLGDFVFKARGYSHTDRLGPSYHAAKLLRPERIKRAVCQGNDFFEMLPEAYEWAGLIGRWNGAGKREGGELPGALVERMGTNQGRDTWGWLVGDDERERCRNSWEVGDAWKWGDLQVPS